ncbi:Uncharacterised protein [Providencia rettgeri]|nr:Uncharacterised protein [Providencia rettgeri]CAB5709073.1 Uncharacterised protein [Providencia rettgeri]CAC9154501.1 Uncharacterised protein [Providencia rettgeri]CAC9265271.1 Uncharacterised protein [Providencia rettgeri]SPZ18235.1 Uncharacterised protein [Providencia rettgeri]
MDKKKGLSIWLSPSIFRDKVNNYFALPWFATAACFAAISSWLPK